jgi:tRNA (adenine22-N1)-methyltransferase
MLSARLEAVLAAIEPCERVLDIGTDHALLPIELIRRGICQTAVASDIRPGPLAVARRNIAAAELAAQIEVVQTEGLSGLKVSGRDVIVLSGLGGLEMIDILSPEPRHCRQLVLQPQKSAPELRLWLSAARYRIDRESLVRDRGYLYTIISARPDWILTDAAPAMPSQLSLLEAVIGPDLLHRRPPEFIAYLSRLARHLEAASRRQPELASILPTIRELLSSPQTVDAIRPAQGGPDDES